MSHDRYYRDLQCWPLHMVQKAVNIAGVLHGLQFDDLPRDDRVSMQEVCTSYYRFSGAYRVYWPQPEGEVSKHDTPR